MRWWPRRTAPPPDRVTAAARAAGLPAREEVLAHARAEDDTWLLGTRRRLVVVPPDAAPAATVVLPWEQVQRADWDQESATLQIRQVAADGSEPPPAGTHVLGDPRDFLMLLRERVTASMLLQHRVQIAGKQGVTVVARRAPTGDGPVTMTWELDAGLDPRDPGVWGVVQGAVRDAKDMLGMP